MHSLLFRASSPRLTVAQFREIAKLRKISSKRLHLRFAHSTESSQGHTSDCPDCGQHTLHVSDESQRCVNPRCKHRSGVDAEGNVYVNGEIVSNGGKSIEQLRNEYFDGSSFMFG